MTLKWLYLFWQWWLLNRSYSRYYHLIIYLNCHSFPDWSKTLERYLPQREYCWSVLFKGRQWERNSNKDMKRSWTLWLSLHSWIKWSGLVWAWEFGLDIKQDKILKLQNSALHSRVASCLCPVKKHMDSLSTLIGIKKNSEINTLLIINS